MEKFSYETNGYNRQEVNEFVKDVIRETEGVITRVRKQTIEIEDLKRQLVQYQMLENSVNGILKKAEETSEDMKRLAREESSMIITEAKQNASRIVNEALLKAEKTDNERETIERNMRIFKKKLRTIMEQQMAVVEEIEVLELDED